MTQKVLGQKLSLTAATVSAYENGAIPIEVEVKLCELLDTSSDFLLGVFGTLPYQMGGLTDAQSRAFMQLINLMERANERES